LNVGILGSGDVGQALGRGFASHGHDVKIGSRTPNSDKLKAWLKQTTGKTSTGTFAEAAAHGEILVLAAQGAAAENVIDLAGPEKFTGKVVIDTTNPLDFSKGSSPTLFVGITDSLGERIQRKLLQAKIVKCFNIVSNLQMVNPTFSEGKPEMLICGNDAQAKQRVIAILKEFGWPGAIDTGGIEEARWLETLVPLWVRVGAALNTWRHAFKVVRG
jgi:8-hydroxy-5-deazaflavin:NADPH oxidoreductase